jgi:hypothetical protein
VHGRVTEAKIRKSAGPADVARKALIWRVLREIGGAEES